MLLNLMGEGLKRGKDTFEFDLEVGTLLGAHLDQAVKSLIQSRLQGGPDLFHLVVFFEDKDIGSAEVVATPGGEFLFEAIGQPGEGRFQGTGLPHVHPDAATRPAGVFEIDVDVDPSAGDPAQDVLAQAGFQFSEIAGHEKVDLALLAVDRGGLHADHNAFSGMGSAAKSGHAVHARFYQRPVSSGERETPVCNVRGKGIVPRLLLLRFRWRIEQIGTISAGALQSARLFPSFNLAVVARKENLRNLESSKIDRLCVGGSF